MMACLLRVLVMFRVVAMSVSVVVIGASLLGRFRVVPDA